jgi:hypothetical protein
MMTPDEILKCKIPEGDYELGLLKLQEFICICDIANNSYTNLPKNPKQLDSLCACFYFLYRLANGHRGLWMKICLFGTRGITWG